MHQIIENTPEAMLVADRKGRITLANLAARKLFKRPIPLGEDYPSHAQLYIYQSDGAPYDPRQLPLTRSALDGVLIRDLEIYIRWPDGERGCLLVNSAPIRDQQGNLDGAVAIFQDISTRKQAEAKTRMAATRAKVIAALSQAFAEVGLDYQAVLQTVTRRIAESFRDACVIFLLSEDGAWLEPASHHYPDLQISQTVLDIPASLRIPASEGLIGRALQRGKTAVLPETSSQKLKALGDDPFWTLLDQSPINNAMFVPLRVHGELLGSLGVFRFNPGKPYTAEDQAFIENVASRAALAIENARLYAIEYQRARALDALHTATTALLNTLDLDTLLSQILDAAQRAVPTAEKGTLYLVASETGQLRVSAALGFADARSRMLSNSKISGYITRVVRERNPLLIEDALVDSPPTDEQVSDPHTIRSAIIAPLILADQVLGVVSLNASRPFAFKESDLKLLVSFAATTSAAIQNARLHAKVQKMAITDALTGLYNRRGFFELGRREIERLRRFGHPLSAIMLDIDDFKLVNDDYGHAIGDQVLRSVADRLEGNVRGVDVLGRYGGDEFCILLPETDLFTATTIADRLRHAVADQPVSTSKGLLHLTISLGVVKATPTTPNLEVLINQADAAMYTAKQAGRNRVEVK